MFLQTYNEKQYFVDTTCWQKVCLQPRCLVLPESQSDELYGLRHTAVLLAIRKKGGRGFYYGRK